MEARGVAARGHKPQNAGSLQQLMGLAGGSNEATDSSTRHPE